MKKNFMWTMAALFVSGLAFTACQVEDNPNPDPLAEFTPSAIDFEDEDVSMFTIADPARMTVSVVDDEATGSKVASFTRSNSSSRGFAYYNFAGKTENATAVTVSFDFQVKAAILAPSAITVGDAYVHNATYGINEGQYGYTSNGAIFNIGATRGKINGSNTNYFWINDQPAAVDNDSYEIKAADIWGQWLHVDLDINVANREYTYVVKKGSDVLFSSGDAPIAFLSDNAATCTQIDIASGNTGTYLLDNISVQKQGKDENIKYADYTVKFVDTEGNALPEDLKPAITRRAKVGTAITLLDSDKANFTNGDGSIKYTYESDNSAEATVTAEGTVVTVVYKVEEMQKYKYRLNLRINKADGTTERMSYVDGEQFEGQTVMIGYVASFYKDGVWYTTPIIDKANGKQTNAEGRYYTFTGNEDKNSQGVCQKDIYYDVDNSYVYIADFENTDLMTLVGSVSNTDWASFNGGVFNRFSNGRCAKLTADSYMYTKPLAGGTYQVYIFGRNDANKGEQKIKLGVVSPDGTLQKLELETNGWANSATDGVTINNVVVPEGYSLAIINEGGSADNLSLDILYVVNQPAEE